MSEPNLDALHHLAHRHVRQIEALAEQVGDATVAAALRQIAAELRAALQRPDLRNCVPDGRMGE